MIILVIAPHPDDEILGVGGTMAKYVAEGHNVYVCIVSKGCLPLFSDEIVNKVRSEARKCHEMLGIKETFYLDFPAAMLEEVHRYDLNVKLYEIIRKVNPDIVYIPHYGDIHKDHQVVSEAAMVALRPKNNRNVEAIYSYETLSETEWSIPHASNSFIPNVYVDISNYIDNKIEAMKQYASQLSDFPNPRSIEAIAALAKLRGSTVSLKAAEAFSLIRLIQ